MEKKLEKELLFITLVVVAGHALGILLHWYNKYFFFDIIVHFSGGAWIIFAAFAFLPVLRENLNLMSKARFVLSLALLALFIGVLWEIFEFSIDRYAFFRWGFIPGVQGSPLDTLLDLIIDTLGGIAAALYIKSRGWLLEGN
ncbi:MAG: hypothetical protein KJI72_02920 [Patescibacteria group bacterium]|nr:hypothetical protein [Patescibacteria group bacterium]